MPARAPHRIAVLLLLTLVAIGISPRSQAAEWHGHLGIGAASPIDGRWTGVASIGAARDWRRFAGGDLDVDLTLFGIRGRADVGAHLRGDIQVLAVGLRWQRGGWVLGFSPGAATARTAAVSGSLQFASTAGYQWPCCALLLQHISNGSTNGRNVGETMLMLEWRFGRFRL